MEDFNFFCYLNLDHHCIYLTTLNIIMIWVLLWMWYEYSSLLNAVLLISFFFQGVVAPDIYPHKMVLYKDVQGSCALFDDRRDITENIKSISLKKALNE